MADNRNFLTGGIVVSYRQVSFEDSSTSSETEDEVSSLSQQLQIRDQAEAERLMLDNACRAFLESSGIVGEEVIQSRNLTPFCWVKFRQHIEKVGKLEIGNKMIIVMVQGILLKCSTMSPICSLPTCYSTYKTTNTPNRRCAKHYGDTASFAVMELVFHEILHGHTIAVGIEHVNLMFSHYDSEIQMSRVRGEYESSGLMKDTWRRLKDAGLNRAAGLLRLTREVTVRRHWIMDNAQAASNQFYKIAMAAGLVYRKLGNKVVPSGEFQGQHLEIVVPNCVALEGDARFNIDVKLVLSSLINEEQLTNYGVAGEKIKLCY